MSFVGFGSTGGGGRTGGPSRGRIQNGAGPGVSYPSPFFDLASTYLPTTIKHMLRWCRYYFLTQPLINSVVFKLSEYPVTDLIVDHEDPKVKAKWTEYLHDHLRINSFRVESGLDYFTMGNSFTSMSYPFKKHLECKSCRYQEPAEKITDRWIFTSFKFRLTCPRCGNVGDAAVKDIYYKSQSGIHPLRWNAEDIDITYNEVTGAYTYYYTLPATVKNDITIGKKTIVMNIPQVFIQAMQEMKGVVFSKENFFHMRRPTLAGQDRGWGIPLLLPVLKDTFYLQLMKKAQEAVLSEHLLPLRILFPQAGSGSADPYTTVNLIDWRDQVGQEIARWRQDPLYIPILPLPVGNQSIGGDGRALLLTQEMQAVAEQIIGGMGVPREFIFGGLSWTGSNVTMRMLENAFLGYVARQKQLITFMVKQVAAFLEWPEVGIGFKPFKMADDLQRKAYLFQLNQAKKISDTTLLADDDLSQDEENAIMASETDKRVGALRSQQLAEAEIQGEVQQVMMKYQAKGQQVMQAAMQQGAAPGEPGGPETQGAGGAPGAVDPAIEGVDVPADLGGGMDAAPGPTPVTPGGTSASNEGSPHAYLQSMASRLQGGQKLNGQAGVDLPSLAMMHAKTLASAAPEQQQAAIAALQQQSPPLADLVQQYLGQLGQKTNGTTNGAGVTMDTRPLPEARPPRRATPSV